MVKDLKDFSRGYQIDEEPPETIRTRETLTRGVFPSCYDMCEKGFVTPVKMQALSNCWIYSTIAAVESFLLKNGKISLKDKLYADLSEMHMTYSMFDQSDEPEYRNPYGKAPNINKDGSYSYSGQRLLSLCYLTRGVLRGCTPELADPDTVVDQSVDNPQMVPRKLGLTLQKAVSFYATDVKLFKSPEGNRPDGDYINEIKEAILERSAVYVVVNYIPESNMAIDKSCIPYRHNYYAYREAVEGDTETNGWHAVTIVGWDDDYPKESFNSRMKKDTQFHSPPVNGAFKVKNSHGTYTNKKGQLVYDGYFWLSYADACLTKGLAVSGIDTEQERPLTVKHHDVYGMCDELNDFRFMDSFTVANIYPCEQGEELIAVGLFTMNECLVDIFFEHEPDYPLNNIKLRYAGYHTVNLPRPVKGREKIGIVVKYTAIHSVRLFPPVERRLTSRYRNIKVEPDRCFLLSGEDWIDMAEIHRDKPELGYIPMRAIFENNSPSAVSVRKVCREIALPAQKDGFLSNLPCELSGQKVDWTVEPDDVASYSGVVEPKAVKIHSVGPSGQQYDGIAVKGDKTQKDVCVSVEVGLSPTNMRRLFTVDLDAPADHYDFTFTDVKQGDNTSTLSGSFPVIGAIVTVTANDRINNTGVDNNGKWSIIAELYDAEEGYKDEYENTELTVCVTDMNGTVLMSSKATVKVPPPYIEKKDKGDVYWIVGGVVGLLSVLGLGGYYLWKRHQRIVAFNAIGQAHRILEDLEPLLRLEGVDGPCTITQELSGVDPARGRRVLSLKSVDITTKITTGKTTHAENNWDGTYGVFADKIEEGGRIMNCNFRVECENNDAVFSIFGEARNVTIENCTVHITGKCAGFSGLVVNLEGTKNIIRNVTITGDIETGDFFGIAETIEQGEIDRVRVVVNAGITGQFAGVVGTNNGAAIRNVLTKAEIRGGDMAVVSGIAATCVAGNITDCKVVSTVTGGREIAGITANASQKSEVTNCYTACKVTAADDSSVYGIAKASDDGVVKDCVTAGSLAEAATAYRISDHFTGSVTYDGTVNGKGKFRDDKGIVAFDRLLQKQTYCDLGWDMDNVWEWDDARCFPVLVPHAACQEYDLPFPYVAPPPGGSFTFPAGETIVVKGYCNPVTESLGWSLHYNDTGGLCSHGEIAAIGSSFEMTIGSFPANRYILEIFSKIGGSRFSNKISVKVQ